MSAHRNGRTLADGILDVPVDQLKRAAVDQRPDLGGRIGRVADPIASDLADRSLDELVVDITVDNDLAGGHAHLSLVHESAK